MCYWYSELVETVYVEIVLVPVRRKPESVLH